jgi:DNA-binding CsgD family transcriptional regulator
VGIRRQLNKTNSDPIPARLAKLSDGQQDCLRLVGQYMSSKEIARILGISPHTVDQRLKRATAQLEVTSRFDAARVYMQHRPTIEMDESASQLCDDLVYQHSGLFESGESAMLGTSPDTLNRSGDGARDELHEYQERYFADARQDTIRTLIWSVLVAEGRENQLSTQARIVVMILIASCAVMGFAAMISIAEGLSRLS